MMAREFLFIIGFAAIGICVILWLAIPELKKNKTNLIGYKTYEVFIRDEYFDYMTDNDDLEDLPTIVRVIYNEQGKILSVNIADSTSDLCDNESPMSRIAHFYKTCNINPHGGWKEYKKFSIYKRY